MFQKPAFGSNTSGFGSFSAGATTSSPFGGFKPAASTSAFGAAPAFGASATPQPAASGGLFGAQSTTGGLFGGAVNATPAPAFGATTGSSFGFGAANTSSGGGLFGGGTAPGTSSLFGGQQQNASAFGAKPAGFGFGSTTTTPVTGSMFGTPATSGGMFGQQTATMGGTGLFGGTSGGFAQQQQTGTGHVKYNPVTGQDVMIKNNTSQNINIKHHCITCMKEYEGKSLEELRFEDYAAGRKGPTNAGGLFGGFQQPTENKPLFGGSTFGQPATTSSQSVFGGGGLGSSTFGQTNTFSFGGNTQNANTSTNLFGANKPAFGATPTAGTGLFGATTTQAPTFGTNTSTFGFGANTQNQSTGLFGAKPATTGFGAPASTGFGSSFGGGLFAAKPAQAQPATFTSTQPAFGAVSSGFGTTTTPGTMFGAGNTFKPATQPTFGFGATQPALGTTLGGGLGANSFQSKPGGTAFPSLNTSGGGLFGATQPAPTLNFNTGNTSLGGGLGGGLSFGNNSTLGGSSLGTLGGFGGTSTTALANNSLSGASAAGNVHEQMLTLAARPYGDSSLFKDLVLDSTTTAEDALRPTNPAAVKAVLDNSGYRVSSPEINRLKVQPKPLPRATDKKSLFDGLEESDASLEDKLSLKPSRKRLVLRPQQNTNHDSNHLESNGHRSLEDTSSSQQQQVSRSEPSLKPDESNKDSPLSASGTEDLRVRARPSDPLRGVNTDLEETFDRHGSWLASSKLSWNDSKEKSIDADTTPRLYPDIDKEINAAVSERRASWLTTKPLRIAPLSSQETVDSVRELRPEPRAPCDKENIDLSEDENVAPREAPPHPTGVKLTRPGYYTIPTLDDMLNYIRPDGRCVVPHLTIGRKLYGNVFYDCEIDVTGLDLDSLVFFLNKEVIIYPEDTDKPPVGQSLNRRAIVTLDRVWPRDKTEKRPITDPQRLMKMEYENKLRRVCDKHDTKFIEYRPQTGSWVFRVEHFSKYGLTDSDEEDDVTPEVLKRQLVNQSLQRNAAPVPKPLQPLPVSVGLGGLMAPEDSLFAMQQTSLNLLNGAGKAFEMDTTEDNADVQTMYPDTARAFGVKSPTSELARLEHRQSHSVQLMKASLYADTEMDDATSVSTGDQLVPQPSFVLPLPSLGGAASQPVEDLPAAMEEQPPTVTEDLPMKPLIVRPYTIVLNYNRKVPPFKKTIAGRLAAAPIADMAICRSRHSRVGFGPANAIAYTASRHSVVDLPSTADLDNLGKYLSGRGADDWSEPAVVRLAVGHTQDSWQNAMANQLEAMLSVTHFEPCSQQFCPKASLSDDPQDRRTLIGKFKDNSASRPGKFGVPNAYCHEVWRLCEALWGADLENGGIPGTDEASIVNRHKQLLEWLTAAVADMTDDALAKSTKHDGKDETDKHSRKVWNLLLGGRVLEACQAAREAGDVNLATLIAQASGDATFRSVLSRQLSLWRQCGAAELIDAHKLRILGVVGAHESGCLAREHWLLAIMAVARYLCPQIPTLEQVVTTYERLLTKPADGDCDDQPDLTIVSDDETGDMRFPVPPHEQEKVGGLQTNGHERRILDLRYELIRARAFNTRPRLHPSSYTANPLDYSLCFLLGAWFGQVSPACITGAAEQLEASGAWHLAAHALSFHPDDRARSHLIKSVLSRHMPSRIDTPDIKQRLAHLRKLKIPDNWVLLARAHRAKYEHQASLEAECLVGAGQWNAAHRLLLDELLAEALLADNIESIAPLLEKMNKAADKHEISGWESGGKALYHYLHVCSEIRGLVSSAEANEDRAKVQSRLEALRPRIAAACRALGGLETRTPRHAAARTEMGSKLLQLSLAAGEPATHLAALLKVLRLPPDCTTHAQHKINSDLAEQASELSIDSQPSPRR